MVTIGPMFFNRRLVAGGSGSRDMYMIFACMYTISIITVVI